VASPKSGARWSLELVGLALLVVFGAVIRAHGFTSFDLWFDDAWAAAPARASISQAIHMGLTAPGYTLLIRSWIRIDPAATWWAQTPAFILGLLAIPAVWALLRWFRWPRWIAIGGAVVVAAGPLLVQYSTRVKEYPFDLLACCLLLFLAERFRRDRTSADLAWLAAASVAGVFCSASCATAVVGVWLAVAVMAAAHRALWPRFAIWAGVTGAGLLAVYALFLRKIPSVLNHNWRNRGYLVDYRSHVAFERTVTMVLGGFIHAFIGYPVPHDFFGAAGGLHAASVAIIGLLVLAVAIGVPVLASVRSRSVEAALPAALVLCVAGILVVLDLVPLGDGRTDEVLYPALLVCLGSIAAMLDARVRPAVSASSARRATAVGAAVAVLAAALTFGAFHRAQYPTLNLRGLAQRLAPLERPGDVVFVDTFNSFAWCYYGLSPCRFQVGGLPVWPQGFRPVSTSPDAFIASHYGIPLPELTAAQAGARRIWYVGYTYGTYDVGGNPLFADFPTSTYMTGLLHLEGWHPATPSAKATTFLGGLHVYAQLYVRDAKLPGTPATAPDSSSHRA